MGMDDHPGTDGNWIDRVAKAVQANITSKSAENPNRVEHWDFFARGVRQIMFHAVDESLGRPSDSVPGDLAADPKVREYLLQRFTIRDRFRASEPLYFMLKDADCAGADHEGTSDTAYWIAASVELLQFGRLVTDDLLDRHTHRWGQPTLWALNGTEGTRSEHLAGVAQVTSTMLVQMAIMCAENAEQIGHRDGLLRAVDAPGRTPFGLIVADHARRMWEGMMLELAHIGPTMSYEQYQKVAHLKHCNGSLCVQILDQFEDAHEERSVSQLRSGILMTDLAASIANDFSEVNGLRGFGLPRSPEREPRGAQTEIALGRPSIFQTFTATDDFVRKTWSRKNAVLAVQSDLAAMAPDDLESNLLLSGALQWAEGKRESLKEAAQTAIQRSNYPSTFAWSTRTAVVHEDTPDAAAP